MIGSPDINKVIRRRLSPVLKQSGFARVRVRVRHNWGWRGPCCWLLDIRAVGGYFARVTCWPPMSVSVSLGIYYDFVPLGIPREVKVSPDGRPLPTDVDCHQRCALHIGLDQRQYTQQLKNPAEQSRTDLWWIEPDGSNTELVVQDVAQQFLVEGLPWFDRMADIATAYGDIQKEHDCLHKFSRAAYLAKHLNYEGEYRKYRALLEDEAVRIGGARLLAQYP